MGNTTVNIIGVGCICAAGETLDTCMESMLRGQGSPVAPTRFAEDLPTTSPVFEVSLNTLAHTDENTARTVNLLFSAMDDAMHTAQFTNTGLSNLRVGVCIGTSVGASLNILDFYHQWKDGEKPDLFPVQRYLNSNPARALAKRYGFNGPCQTVTNACTSGTDAIGMGTSWIRNGLCDVVIAGGADELDPISYTGFTRLMITSPEACRPFDVNRKGLNLGEGAGLFILASPSATETIGAPSRGQIAGFGTCGDAHHLTAPSPEGKGLRKAIATALDTASITNQHIDFINVHGTGTPANDPVEGAVMNDLFKKAHISATKGFTGHTLGAAGAIEAAFTLACMERKELPPSKGFANIDPQIGRAPVTERTPLSATYGMSESLAFGGNNSVLIIKGSES